MTSILSTNAEFTPISDVTASASLGLEHRKGTCTKDDFAEYVQGVREFLRFEFFHPEAHEAACSEHGEAYIKQFVNRCKIFVQRYDFDNVRPPATFDDNDKYVLTSTEWNLDGGLASLIWEDELTNTAYRRFTNAAALDASQLFGSLPVSVQAEFTKRFHRCAAYGIQWVDLHYQARFMERCSSTQLNFVSELSRLGAKVGVLDSQLTDWLTGDPLVLLHEEEILQSVRDGVPLEWIIASMKDVKV